MTRADKMIIPFRELTAKIKSSETSNGGYYWNDSGVDDKTLANLLLCILYHNKKINRASFLARMNGEPTRRVHTYKSKVLNEWFSDVPLIDVLLQEATSCNNLDLTFEEYFEHLNLGLNRNRNYCIDVIAIGVFKSIQDRHSNYNSDYFCDFVNASKLTTLESNTYEATDSRYDLGNGYCCDDCDGDYENYKRQRWHFNYRIDDKEVSKQLKNVFLPMKTHLRNMDDKVANW